MVGGLRASSWKPACKQTTKNTKLGEATDYYDYRKAGIGCREKGEEHGAR